ncbi:bifunctional phosphoribosyl-AMP cyclohydrolase/phosphoribosyl-ATP pyrophosphatase [Helicobacter valdiviensis]|uniref:Histidine biosynthesis bifunctional protein HisIE n=1 Tax=Helicobacter valdiviensis TaxID=1458358 RepID=A0A2W6PL57_9HELI|nr:bifunctional phosphoribosyl-AMP cyclohydrolase/phosphoribosyl-ATP diphosphatase HisIE [Helicobacter valdiviensis]PZT47393.1 bifunctional phosphoribosyl-AMP cyclohydrolase/phosphoribosyl-ATP pyrophosphatase [Helicobacter valdiviensis]
MANLLESIEWNKGLIPLIVQDEKSNEVLMLGFTNKEALCLSIQTGFVHYYSRSKQRIWKKGEQSGHTQEIKEILLDCDKDTLLIRVKQNGVACHSGNPTCFFQSFGKGEDVGKEIKENTQDVGSIYGAVDLLYHTLQERKNADSTSSYTASLFKKGENTIGKKIVEEAAEFAFALKDDKEEDIIYEATDLLYHALVGLAYKNISPDRVRQELLRRFNVSGIAEKNSRPKD